MVFGKEDLGLLVKQALKSREESLKKKNITCELVFPDGVLSVVADSQKLVIALSNILKNAEEAIEEENGKLRIVIHSTDNHYTLSIRDNGNGIPAEFIPRIFDPFFTLKKNGVGLGLTAAYSILNAHKSSVHVESIEGEGTLFMLSFPK
jgi:signal transduction histidine kinase